MTSPVVCLIGERSPSLYISQSVLPSLLHLLVSPSLTPTPHRSPSSLLHLRESFLTLHLTGSPSLTSHIKVSPSLLLHITASPFLTPTSQRVLPLPTHHNESSYHPTPSHKGHRLVRDASRKNTHPKKGTREKVPHVEVTSVPPSLIMSSTSFSKMEAISQELQGTPHGTLLTGSMAGGPGKISFTRSMMDRGNEMNSHSGRTEGETSSVPQPDGRSL
ncbi:hypothetical protein Hamer_G006025 [Homarus americanus]|uniref:Uncharacterized protein n=1 Tax=Homarus americanus TaxID=6706 RepID=A0A8J5JFC6_HOMAM|nr:hypothetical protein Hamer_G006025 [Homarus americanus]